MNHAPSSVSPSPFNLGVIASSLSDFLADASLALHLGAAFIAPLLPGCRVAFPPFLSRMPICLVSACLPGNGQGRFGAGGGGRGGAGRELGGGGGEMLSKIQREGQQSRWPQEGAGTTEGAGGYPRRRGSEGTNQFSQQLRG